MWIELQGCLDICRWISMRMSAPEDSLRSLGRKELNMRRRKRRIKRGIRRVLKIAWFSVRILYIIIFLFLLILKIIPPTMLLCYHVSWRTLWDSTHWLTANCTYQLPQTNPFRCAHQVSPWSYSSQLEHSSKLQSTSRRLEQSRTQHHSAEAAWM